MSQDREQIIDQIYNVAAKPEQPDLVEEAKELAKACRPYIEKATFERDFSAYPILAKLDWFLKQ